MSGGHTVVEIRRSWHRTTSADAMTPELRATEDRLRAEGNARLNNE